MIKKILQNYGIDALNEMQEAMLKATKDHREVLLLAPTGSGKTLGFLLPAYMGLKQSIKGVQVLIVVPSRELASQIEQVFKQMGTGFKVNAFFGGHSSRTEKNSLIDPPAVLIGTP
ncbi:MAG TPA: DEAD/DEAH box helicase, partial [Saprospiraceae bacterium]|nr:DEAD/DEAH box helicase [Saprospiraceae bacterium]